MEFSSYIAWNILLSLVVAPTAKPSDGKRYYWNEGTTSWVEIE